ncbi:MAG: addiction module toxin RelE [Candidatus Woesearchaeota archaeon]|nr:addiction module toxin RelE [Candidatus Woesearchaeota archaeon]
MRKFSIEDKLQKILVKLFKKDRKTHDIILAKMQEIISCEDVNHYKNLKKPKQHLKRVHIQHSFVLTFQYIEIEDTVIFWDYEHHDDAY